MASKMQSANRLLNALNLSSKSATSSLIQSATSTSGTVSFGAWQMLPGSNLSRTLARSGFDWVCVDCEHGNIDDGEMHEAVAAIAACGISPLVRVADNQGWMVKRALDSGAHGIVVPLLSTAADARALVSSAKFPPLGKRGFGSPYSAEKFGPSVSMTDYLVQANSSLLTIVQIETAEAVANLEEIAQVDGIDVLFVGPFDLGNALGCPILDGTMHETLKSAIAKVVQTARKYNKASGIYALNGQQAQVFADQGFQMISVTSDVGGLGTYCAGQLKVAKGSIAHSAYNLAKGAVSSAANLASGSSKE